MIFFSTLILSLFITLSAIPVLIRVAGRFHLVDVPDARKMHSEPKPNAGGLAIALGMLVPVLLWCPVCEFLLAYLAGAGIVVLFGIVDDLKGIGYRTKLAGQATAALVVILYGGLKIQSLGGLLPGDYLLPAWAAVPLTALVIVGVTNAINLSDGLDGLAGGISLLCLCCIAYLAFRLENLTVALIAIAITGSIFSFLRFNSHPAALFMGDTGSQFLGFSIVTLSLALSQGHTPVSPLFPLLLLGFPILDTLFVMAERIARGDSPFSPDANHLHHKLVRLGLYQTEAVAAIYAIQVGMVLSAYYLRFYSEWTILSVFLGFSAVVAGFSLAFGRNGWRLNRHTFIDREIKGRLRVLKQRALAIKISFRALEYGLPLLLIIGCLLPQDVPPHIATASLAWVAVILLVWRYRRGWLESALGIVLFLLVPVMVYLVHAGAGSWMAGYLKTMYNLSYGILAVFALLTLRYTRRRQGFRLGPLDFLIFFVGVVVPNLPDQRILNGELGLIAAKVIVLFFGLGVLMGELRGQVNRLSVFSIAALAALGIRGLVG